MSNQPSIYPKRVPLSPVWIDSLKLLDFSSFIIFSDDPWSLLVSFSQLFKLPLVVQFCDIICEWPLKETAILAAFESEVFLLLPFTVLAIFLLQQCLQTGCQEAAAELPAPSSSKCKGYRNLEGHHGDPLPAGSGHERLHHRRHQ